MPVAWGDDSDLKSLDFYRPSVAAMARLVRKAKVAGVFLSKESTWGSPVTGPWRHFAASPPPSSIYKPTLLKTAGQAMAEKREEYGIVQRALAEFTVDQLTQAVTLLKSDSLYRSEKVLGPIEWLHSLKLATDGAHSSARSNFVWAAIARAPAGFCHPRSSMAGTLLDDIAAGMDFEDVSRRFKAKMHPLQYQRPQAAPSSGAIAQAEKVIQQLNAAGSLARRFARIDEVEALWTPKPPNGKAEGNGSDGSGNGVFAHLKPKGASPPINPLIIPPSTMTWDKFSRTVLPSASSIEYYVPSGPNSYAALVTAVNPDAPPILQWDREDRRNPVSWYLWHGGSSPSQWGLVAGKFRKVNAITLNPAHWGTGPASGSGTSTTMSHHGHGVLFILDGAKDTRMAGAAIFPETLKSEFHGIRSVIESYSRGASIEGLEESSASGILLANGNGGGNPFGARSWDARFRVTAGGVTLEYRLDRWD